MVAVDWQAGGEMRALMSERSSDDDERLERPTLVGRRDSETPDESELLFVRKMGLRVRSCDRPTTAPNQWSQATDESFASCYLVLPFLRCARWGRCVSVVPATPASTIGHTVSHCIFASSLLLLHLQATTLSVRLRLLPETTTPTNSILEPHRTTAALRLKSHPTPPPPPFSKALA